jgi:glycosyltransferase involved in cell wall biosynthesis
VVGGTLFGLEQDYEHELKQEGARLLPAGSVHFLGHRPDLPEILADVDVLVHCPLTPEPFGLVLLEAMAMQVPVVATHAGGPKEIVNHGETGNLVPPGDTSALAAAILRLLENKSNRMTMGGAARRRVHERFSAESMVRQLERYFEQVVLGGSTLSHK